MMAFSATPAPSKVASDGRGGTCGNTRQTKLNRDGATGCDEHVQEAIPWTVRWQTAWIVLFLTLRIRLLWAAQSVNWAAP